MWDEVIVLFSDNGVSIGVYVKKAIILKDYLFDEQLGAKQLFLKYFTCLPREKIMVILLWVSIFDA